MPIPPRYFARVPESVNLPLLQSKLVVVIGVGMVGSPIAEKLAISTIGRLRFIDDDLLKPENLARHVLPVEYVGWNKAEGLAVYLAKQIEGLQTEAVPRKIDKSVSNNLLDKWLADADLIVAATDDREAQRRIGSQALALGLPVIFPALYPMEGGGEVVVQLDPVWPCFGCWDYFRRNTEQLRGENALAIDGEPVIHTSVKLCIGILDPDSEHRNMMMEGLGEPPNQLFLLNRMAVLRRMPLTRRPDCQTCRGGPSLPRRDEQPWGNRSTGIRTVPTNRPALAQPPTPSNHPPAFRGSTKDAGDLIASGLGVFLLWFFLTEGFDDFKFIWNPLAWIAVIAWWVYALSD